MEQLEMVGITKTYGEGAGAVTALADLSLSLTAGSFTAVMGPSGSGKSTLLRCAAGLEAPTRGTVSVGGNELTGRTETERTRFRRNQIGFVFQGFNLLPYLTAEQNVGLPLRLAGRRPVRGPSRKLLEELGLADRTGHLPAQLSGGQQQRVAIARALVTAPSVVFADEPTGALDSRSAREVLAMLRGSTDRLGQTIVMVTHDPIAASYADAVVFLVDGRTAGTMTDPTAESVAAQMTRLDGMSEVRP